jgi:hypothetical protein
MTYKETVMSVMATVFQKSEKFKNMMYTTTNRTFWEPTVAVVYDVPYGRRCPSEKQQF